MLSQSDHPKGSQPWIFIGRTDVEALILWPPDAESQLIGKDSDVEKDCGQEEKASSEDERVGWCHWLNGHEPEQTLGDSEGQGSLVCYSSWGWKRVGHDLVTKQQQQMFSEQCLQCSDTACVSDGYWQTWFLSLMSPGGTALAGVHIVAASHTRIYSQTFGCRSKSRKCCSVSF